LFLTNAQAKESLPLTLKKEVWVNTRYIMLSDLVQQSKSDLDGAGVEDVKIRPAPRIGRKMIVDKKTIVSSFQRQSNGETAIDLKGYDSAIVHASGETLKREQYLAEAATVLREYLQDECISYEYKIHSHYKDIKLPLGKWELQGTVNRATGPASHMMVKVEVRVDDEFYRSIPVWFDVAFTKKVYVINSPVLKGEKINRQTLLIKELDVSKQAGHMISINGDAEIFAKRDLKPGDTLSEFNARLSTGLEKNHWINLVLRSNGISIKKRVRIRKNVKIGEIVTVQGYKSNELYDVLLVAKDKGEPVWCEQRDTPHCL